MRIYLATCLSVLLFLYVEVVSGFQCSPIRFPGPPKSPRTTRLNPNKASVKTNWLARKTSFLRSFGKNEDPKRPDGVIAKTDNVVDDQFDPKATAFLVGAQSLLIGVAVVFASIFKTPNYGFGPHIHFSVAAVQHGLLMTTPLAVLALLLDKFEDKFPALQEVTKATLKSVYSLLGGTFKPVVGLVISVALGLAAGFGEEMLFRGILQYGLAAKLGNVIAVVVASVIFGALHAVTPMYAFLAWTASLYFGYLYISSGNLAVPIFTHTFYDIGALFYAHWSISKMTKEEKSEIATLQ